jgi:hypothetical protein
MTVKYDYRLRITMHDNSRMYLVRRGKIVSYLSSSEVPNALSNLVQGEAAELRFALEDAPTSGTAARRVQDVLKRIWARNLEHMPKVEVI